MPESVADIAIKKGDIFKYDFSIVKNIVEAYFEDMNHYVNNSFETLKIHNLYDSIPAQLVSQNSKFQITSVNKNARFRDYEETVLWLVNSYIVVKSDNVKVPTIPFPPNKSGDFKLYLSDIGI